MFLLAVLVCAYVCVCVRVCVCTCVCACVLKFMTLACNVGASVCLWSRHDCLLFQDHLNMSIEAAALHPEVSCLEAEVFARVCPLFEPPEDGLCSDCDSRSNTPVDPMNSAPLPLPRLGGRDSGLEIPPEQDGVCVNSTSPTGQGTYIPPSEVIGPHRAPKAVESGISSDGSYFALQEHSDSVGLVTRQSAGEPVDLTQQSRDQRTALHPLANIAAPQESHDQRTAPHPLGGRSPHDQRMVTTRTRTLWRKTNSIETDV